ncbi:NKG2D ligand 4 [Carlito syrichta]|uniref:NKG2D ligand 4 n=1 Tax=Carlito syrichta TaxID=1868482 RepID=A0A3Q0DVQ2_CARSF|nr:NKG2D ligand 4 [Carlito syrichta]
MSVLGWRNLVRSGGEEMGGRRDWGFKQVSDAHSLCLLFTVKSWSRPGQPWCEVQGSVDKEPFLQSDSDSQAIKPLGPLGKKVNATRTGEELTPMLKEVGQELRMILFGKLEETEIRRKCGTGHPTLEAKVLCQCEAEQCTGAFWEFSINGQKSFLFDTMNRNWTVINPGANRIKEKWEKDRELTEYFRKISTGDCNHWLRKFLEQWKMMLEVTGGN